ncbi:hypothetical protein OS493_008622 [Desmophyllum pertusum]|uniref:Uncharacterized protein n=1 Tax=Desmophyllum pertusum TaxID=174260 RepID=A0A9X0D5J1_9CNID|nr:hypothetical protein OS493_008622 [Desmophyllum pertusum]
MSQLVTRRVLLYSSASPEHHIEIDNNKADTILKTETLSSSVDEVIDPDSDRNHRSQIVFNLHSDEDLDDSKANTTTTSTQVIRRYVTDVEEQKEFTIHTNPVITTAVNIENVSKQAQKSADMNPHFDTDDKDPHKDSTSQSDSSYSQMESFKSFQIENGRQDSTAAIGRAKEENSDSTQIFKTTTKRRSTKTSYTYRLQDGIAILENVTRHKTQGKSVSKHDETDATSQLQEPIPQQDYLQLNRQQTHTTKQFMISQTQESGKTSTSFQTKPDRKEDGQRHQKKERYSWSTKIEQTPSTQDTQKVAVQDASSPRRLGQLTSNNVAKHNSEQWITRTTTYQELKTEIPTQTQDLPGDKRQFHQSQDSQPSKSLVNSSTGRLVLPDFRHHTTSMQVTLASKIEKRNDEQRISQTNTREQRHFNGTQDTNPTETSRGKIVIPDFNQNITILEKERTPYAKLEKRISQEWVTQTTTEKEQRSELQSPTSKLSAERIIFLQNKDTTPAKTFDGHSPRKLIIPDLPQKSPNTQAREVIPYSQARTEHKTEEGMRQSDNREEFNMEFTRQANRLTADKMQFLHKEDTEPVKKLDEFNQYSSTIEVKDPSPPPKEEKRKTDEWVTQVVTQEEVRSEAPLQANRLSADKMQFIHTQDTEPSIQKLDGQSPGRLVIPQYNRQSWTIEDKEPSPPPKVEKRKPEEWVTQIVTQEEVRSEPPLQTSKLKEDKMQFLHKEDTEPVKKLLCYSPGKLVIPEFNQYSSTIEVKDPSSPPKVEKRKTDEWVTQVVTQEEVRSEPPLQANRLSADKMQFLHTQDTETSVQKLDGQSPGRLVIPQYNRQSWTIEDKEPSSPPKAEKRKPEEWVTQIVTQEEVRSEPPLQTSKLSADKMHFLNKEDTEPVKKLDGYSPGKLVIPEFNQYSSTVEVKDPSPPPKVEKRKTEEWVTQVVTQEEVRSEPPLQANRLSADKMQFLHKEDTEPTVKKLDGHSPGRLVIHQYNRQSWTIEDKEPSPPPKVEKRQPEEWVTQKVTQEEVKSEPPLQTSKLSADKMHFLNKEDTEPVKKLDGYSPGKLVIPEFNQYSSTVEVKDPSPPPKVEKRKTEEWVTQVVTQGEVRSEPPLQANRLSADKMQFLHKEDTEPTVKKLDGHSPGRLVIPQYNRQSWTIEDKEPSPPPKVEKRQPEEWVTQIVTQEEVRSEPPLQTSKLSADKMHFLNKEDTEPVKKLDGYSPGKLVIPEFNQYSSTVEVKDPSPPPKVEKRKTEEWVTQVVTQEEVRSEPPLQANRLSADKMQFLHKEDTEPTVKKLDGHSPGRLVIPQYNRQSWTIEDKEPSPPPKVEKCQPEEWVTQIVTQEEVRSEPPLQTSKLSADKMHFLNKEDTEPVKKLDGYSPGKLVIPEFNQYSSTVEVKDPSPPPKVEKRKTEEWVTQVVTQEEVRSEPPLQANRLSADKMQFLHKEDTEPTVKKLDGHSPGRLVIPQYNRQSWTIEDKEPSPPPKVEKCQPEEWVTQIVTQEEVRSEPPLQTSKLSADKMHFLNKEDTEPVKKLDGYSPGKLVIPEFNQYSSTVEVKDPSPPPKVEKRKTEEWVTQVVTQEEVRSEPPLQANRLSADKMQFLHKEDTEPTVKKLDGHSPGRLVIPQYNRQSWTIEDKEPSPPPKVEKRQPEEWVTQIVTQEEVRSEPPLQTSKLSADKMQFLHKEDTEPTVKKLDGHSPGRLVIPQYNRQSWTIEDKEPSPPPKVEKRQPEEWVTQVVTQEEVRSEPPLQANRLSEDKMQFLHKEDTEPSVQKLNGHSPGRLVIPQYNRQSWTIEDKEPSPSPKVEKRQPEEWVTQIVTQEEVRSEPPLQTSKLSADKMHFLNKKDTEPVKKLDGYSPGKLVIPEFNQYSSTVEVKDPSPPPKVEKRKTEEWVTQVVTQEEVRSEPPLQANRLSADKMQFLHKEDTEPTVKKLDGHSPGRLVIPQYNRQSWTIEDKEPSPPPKVEKRQPEEWVTQIVTQEEVRSEPPLQTSKLSADKMHFLNKEETEPVKKLDGYSPGKLVIPEFNQYSSTVEVKDPSPPPKVEKRKTEEWVTQVVTQGEVRSEPPLQANRLSADKMQFLHKEDTEPTVKKLDGHSPGRLVIPQYNRQSWTIEDKEPSPPPKVEKRQPETEEWVTQVVTQEEVRSEPPLQANRLSADKMQFLHKEDTEPTVKKLDGHSPGRLVIPQYNRQSWTIEDKEPSPPPKVEKCQPEEWVTQIVTQEEVRSEPPLQTSKLSADKMHFLNKEDTEPVKKLDGYSPGKLVIPEFNQYSSTVEVKDPSPPPKVEKRKTEEWVTQVVTQEEVRSEPPLQANRLSADKMQFLHKEDTEPTVKKLDGHSPGRLVIPQYNRQSWTIEDKEPSPPPKVEKRQPEEWVTQIVTQEEVRSEPPLQTSKLSADKMQFLHKEDTEPTVKKLDGHSPGRLVIPQYNRQSWTIEDKEPSPPPKVEKRQPEEWVTQVVTQEEVRSEPPLQANRLSEDKMQFLHKEDTEPSVQKLDGHSPGRLVIPQYNRQSWTIEDKEPSPSPKVEKRQPEEWVTQIVTQEEVRSEPPLQTSKLSADKMHFLNKKDTEPVKKLDGYSPGKLVIPEFNQYSSTVEVKDPSPPPKVEKRKTEEWVTQVVTQEEVRSEPPLQANRLSADKMQFLHKEDTEPTVKKLDGHSPGRLVIPQYNRQSWTIEDKEPSPPPKVEKRQPEEWVTQIVTQEEVRSEPPLQTSKLSADKMHFLNKEETERLKNWMYSSTVEVKDPSPPPKVEKRKTEEWVTQVVTQGEVRSEPPLQANRLSADKMQFLHKEDTEPTVKKLDGHSPGRLVIPQYNRQSWTIEDKEPSPPPKVEKRQPEEWVTQIVTQEEVRSEPPLQTSKLSADKMHFLNKEDTEPVKKLDGYSPGKLVIPEFNQYSSTVEVKDPSPPPKVEKRKTEEWVTQVVTQGEVRSEPPLQANRLSADKMQFLHKEDTEPTVKKLDGHSPGRLVIPQYNRQSWTIEDKEPSPPPKVEKCQPEEWVTQIVTQEEVRSEPPLQTSKLSADKMHFLNKEDTEPVKKLDGYSPGKLVIPEFNQYSSTVEVKDPSPPPKVEKRKTEEWVTQVVTQEEVRSEPPLQANRLSADKMQFLHKEDTEPTVKKLDGHSPGRLVIPQYNRQSWTIEDKEPSPPPKVEKRQPEEWVTQIVTQEEVRSEPPLQTSKLSADKMHFLNKEDTEPVKKLDGYSPGKLVIPEFNQYSSTVEVKDPSPPPKVEKRKTEEWVTQVVTQEEVRSEPPLQANRLSADKMQFLHKEDTEPTVKKLDGHSPGRLVIPQYNRQSWTIEDKEPSPPPKVEKCQPEEWVTQIVTQEEVRSEPPLQTSKLSADKMHFLNKEDTEPVKKLDGYSPGKLVIPEFNQYSSTVEVKDPSPPPKVEKRKTEEWVTQVVTQEEVRSEPPLQANRLSADKMQFLHKEDTEPTVKKLDGHSPGRLVIPQYNRQSWTIEDKEPSPPPKVEKRQPEEWVTQVVTQEEVRSEPPLQANRLSADKMQFLHKEDTEPTVKKLDGHSPGRLVIPQYNRQSWTIEDKEPSPPPKVEKRQPEEWVTQIVTQEEVRSEPPLQTSKLSADKMHFLNKEDTEPVKKLDGYSPGKLVIPEFNQYSSTVEVKDPSPPPKVEKRKTEEWVTQVVTQEEVRSEPPLQANRLSADKMQFLHKEDTEPTVKKLDGHSPGRLVIPQYNRQSWTIEDKEPSPPPKVEKRQPEEWVTQIVTQEEVRSEPPLQTSKLSADKMHFLNKEETEPVKKLDGYSPGKLVIPEFNQYSSTVEVKDPSPPPKVEKRKTEEWVTQVVTQGEVRSEPPLQANRLSADKMQFLHKEDTEPTVKKLDGHSPGRLVIPQYNRQSWTIEDKEPSPPPKVEKRQPEEWVTQIVTQEEVRSEPPLQANRLSADKMQFLHKEDTEPTVKKLDGHSPGRLVIPQYNRQSWTIEDKEPSPPPKVEKRQPEEWVTQIVTQEEVRSEPPLQTSKLSADKMHFLNKEDTEPVKKLDGYSPGKLVIPEFNQYSSTVEVKDPSPPPKVEKRKTEEWEEVRSEPPLQANRLSADKMQFLHKEDTEPTVKKLDGHSPGRLVIPQYNRQSWTIEDKEPSPPPKVEKRQPEEWVTQIVTQEEVRSEPPLQTSKLSADKMHFLNKEDTEPTVKNWMYSSTIEDKDPSPPPKVEKRKTEEWVTQVVTQEEVRSEPPLQANRLSADKMQFLHKEDTEPTVKKLDGHSPGRLVIPQYNRQSWTIEDKEPSPPPKVEKRQPEEWVTQIVTQEEVRSEPPLQTSKLSADKMHFLNKEDTEPVKKLDRYSPGKLVIPEFNQYSSTIEVKDPSPPPKVEKQKLKSG